MGDTIIQGPGGRVEARYHAAEVEGAPIALILHSHPRAGGNMQDPVAITMFDMFVERGFSVLRYNSRGVGRSQGEFSGGEDELSDAAYILDYLEAINDSPRMCWVAGHSFGAWICLQLLMRRPEISGFFAIAPPANHYDLSFLAPCPASGLIIHGNQDRVSSPEDVDRALTKIRVQKNTSVDKAIIDGGDHFFQDKLDVLNDTALDYLDRRSREILTEI